MKSLASCFIFWIYFAVAMRQKRDDAVFKSICHLNRDLMLDCHFNTRICDIGNYLDVSFPRIQLLTAQCEHRIWGNPSITSPAC